MLTKAQKDELVGNLSEKLSSAKAVFLTNLIGVSSNESNEIRKKVREANGTIVITRNTLMKRAAKGTPVEELVADLKGPNALALAFEDAPSVAKVLYEAGKEQEIISLNAGLLNGKKLEFKEIEALAKLPNKETMLATLLATMMAPTASFVRLMDAIKRKKEEESADPVVEPAN